jgi:hypothetical protein
VSYDDLATLLYGSVCRCRLLMNIITPRNVISGDALIEVCSMFMWFNMTISVPVARAEN